MSPEGFQTAVSEPSAERPQSPVRFTLVITHKGKGTSIIEEDFVQSWEADRAFRHHKQSHPRCRGIREIVPYGTSPLGGIISYTGNCPGKCSHPECDDDM